LFLALGTRARISLSYAAAALKLSAPRANIRKKSSLKDGNDLIRLASLWIADERCLGEIPRQA
jgi:hypothetical protein